MAGTSKVGRKKPEPIPEYECIICGMPHKANEFYKSTNSRIWRQTKGTVPICRECLGSLWREMSDRWGEKSALAIICHYMDLPYDVMAYMAVINKNSSFELGLYIRSLNGTQYKQSSFMNTIVSGELNKSVEAVQEVMEEKWGREDQRNKNTVIEIIGYDPFEGYTGNARKFLFGEILKYFDDDISEDAYKLSVIIQIVINTYQINQCNLEIAKLNPIKHADDIKLLQTQKKSLSDINMSLAKENEISVKNRSNKDVGKSTLTYLMRDLRNKDFEEAEANYYDQLRGQGTQWAADMSFKAIMANGFFDENDKQEVFLEQRKLVEKLQAELDDELEKNRLLQIEVGELKKATKSKR